MNHEQALTTLRNVCAIYKGTLEEHNTLQQALARMDELVKAMWEQDQAMWEQDQAKKEKEPDGNK
jgi:hypothetical protein